VALSCSISSSHGWQAQVIAGSEQALSVYTATLKEVIETQSLYQLQQAQLQIVQQTIGAGADNRLSLDGVQIQLSILARAQLDALAREQRALCDLEDAVQRPLAPGHQGSSYGSVPKLYPTTAVRAAPATGATRKISKLCAFNVGTGFESILSATLSAVFLN
jgi:hypothetical protein